MDEKILGALNDLSAALDAVAESLTSREAESNTGKVLQKITNIEQRFENVSKGIESIKKDTQEIIKNQKTLIKISNDKNPNTSLFEFSGDKKSKIKDGVNAVLLIAGGVLAIGASFKLIGDVDFASVIALSIAMPLVALSFEKISNMKNLSPVSMRNIFFTTVAMSAAILASSKLLSMVSTMSPSQGLTSILIAGTFAVMSTEIAKMTQNLKDISIIDILKMPAILLVSSAAITGASFILNKVMPLSVAQGLTSILIAGTFAIMSHSISKMTNNIKGINVATAALLPLVLIPAAYAITATSHILSDMQTITFAQGLSAIGMSLVLTAMALPMFVLSKAIENINIGKFLVTLGTLPLLAGALYASSMILNKVQPIDSGLLLNITLQSLSISAATTVVGLGIWALSKLGLGIKEAAIGGLTVTLLSGAIAASSHLLSLGKYENYPSLEWAVGTGTSLVAFGLSTIVLGTIASSGVGAVALLAGGAAVIGLSAVIIASAAILSKGKYGNYPNLAWSSGVALSLGAFGLGVMSLGAMIVGSFGAGLAVLAAGSEGIKIVSNTIVESASILSKGTFTGGPTKEWAGGISMALGAFSPIFAMLYDRGILGIFSKGPTIEDFIGKDGQGGIIRGIAESIVAAAEFFRGKTGMWTGGPTAEWAAGVGGAISSFAPVFDAVSKSKSLFGGGIKIEEFIGKDGQGGIIRGIAESIVAAAEFFKDKTGIWTGGPTAEWAAGVGGALQAFAPVFGYLSENNGWFDNAAEDLENIVVNISKSILKSSIILSKGIYTNNIPAGYFSSMTDNIKAYVNLVDFLQLKNKGIVSSIDITIAARGLNKLANGYDKLAKSVDSLNLSLTKLDVSKLSALNTLTSNVVLMSLMDSDQFEKMMDALEDKAGLFINTLKQLESSTGDRPDFGTIKSPQISNDNTEIIAVLNSIDNKMGAVVNNLNSFSNYINEIRTNGSNSIREKRHM